MNDVSSGAPSGRIRRIGTAVARSTLSATLPSTRRLSPLRPWLDIEPYARLPEHGWVSDLLRQPPASADVADLRARQEFELG